MLKKEERITRVQEFIKENYNTELTKVIIEKILDQNEAISKEDLIESGRTQTPFGNVKISYRGERVCRNPKTQEEIKVPEKLTASLSVSSILLTELAEKVDISKYRK